MLAAVAAFADDVRAGGFTGDLLIAAPAAGVRPQVHGLNGREHRPAVKSAHGLQDIHQHDEGLRQVPVDRGPAAVEQVGELLVGGAPEVDEIADANQASLGDLRKQAGEQQAVVSDIAQPFDTLARRLLSASRNEAIHTGKQDPLCDQLAAQLRQTPHLLTLQLQRLAAVHERDLLLYVDQLEELCTLVDEKVGQILDAVRRKGLWDNTIIIFTSDHGEMLGDHYRYHKIMPYEASARIPFLIHAPARLGFQSGGVCDEAVSLDVGFPDAVAYGSWGTDVKSPPERPWPGPCRSLQADARESHRRARPASAPFRYFIRREVEKSL